MLSNKPSGLQGKWSSKKWTFWAKFPSPSLQKKHNQIDKKHKSTAAFKPVKIVNYCFF